MKNKKTIISQKDNYAGNFGLVFRSSAIFYAINNETITTTISFLNYWGLRRNVEVNIILNIRKMDGTLIDRVASDFSNGMVFNYSPQYKNFEGSIEVEVFSLENMVIPYAAVMVVYETKGSISMVHSYARLYSHHEIEEKRTISNGRESCWTIRNSDSIRSFCVMHNGSAIQEKQISKVVITAHDNERYCYDITIPELNAYASYRINLDEYIDNLSAKLKGKPGNASINFELKNSFTRLLVGNENMDNRELQITHSNFNYLEHSTDLCDKDNAHAYMHLINSPEKNFKVIVYPDFEKGVYIINDGDTKRTIKSKERLEYDPISQKQIFSSLEGNRIPTRIVTAISGGNKNKLPFECSLGVIHAKRPPKRMWWGLAATNKNISGSLFITVIDDVYGAIKNADIVLRLYSSSSSDCVEKILHSSEVSRFTSGVLFTDIFSNCNEFLSGEYGYYTVYSEYPGLFIYSGLENKNGSFALEHGF